MRSTIGRHLEAFRDKVQMLGIADSVTNKVEVDEFGDEVIKKKMVPKTYN